MYGSVGGGCMLSSLINFPARQDASALQNMGPQPVKAMEFYQWMLADDCGWNSKFHTQTKDGSESDENCVEQGPTDDGNHESIITPDLEDGSEIEGKPDLEMAGVTCLVCSHQVEAKECNDWALEWYSEGVPRMFLSHHDDEIMSLLSSNDDESWSLSSSHNEDIQSFTL